jgi:hypothetical protein
VLISIFDIEWRTDLKEEGGGLAPVGLAGRFVLRSLR